MLLLKELAEKVEAHRSAHGTFPTDLDEAYFDSWGHRISYVQTVDSFELRSMGRDGLPQTCASQDICGNLDLDTIVTNHGWTCLCQK